MREATCPTSGVPEPGHVKRAGQPLARGTAPHPPSCPGFSFGLLTRIRELAAWSPSDPEQHPHPRQTVSPPRIPGGVPAPGDPGL